MSQHVKKLRFFMLILFVLSILVILLLNKNFDYLNHVVFYMRRNFTSTRSGTIVNSTSNNTRINESNYSSNELPLPLSHCNYSDQLVNLTTNHIVHNVTSFERVEAHLRDLSIRLSDGGKSYATINSKCSPTGTKFKKIAFIVPYRDRLENLKVFLYNMHPYLTSQKIDYGIYLIEPVADLKFNRALLMNIGFIEAVKDSLETKKEWTNSRLNDIHANMTYWDCFVFHDVDMIPEDKRLVYTCNPNVPLHFAVAVKKFGYKTTGYFSQYFGGVNAFTWDQFIKVNGFSTLYFGWGGEDDDMYKRSIEKFKSVGKIPADVGRYYTHEHEQDKPNELRWKLLKHSKELMASNGLFSTSYELRNLSKHSLYTRVLVSYDVIHYMNISSRLP